MLFKRHRFASFTIGDADLTLCYTDIIIRQQSGWLVKVILVASVAFSRSAVLDPVDRLVLEQWRRCAQQRT